ncbi:MAG: pantetheine-phosphate adenylyltransferase [Planctomycetota bacterium]
MSSPHKRALYAGTFDPVTLGHMDLIQRGVDLFGGLVVAVAGNRNKQPAFSVEERIAMLQAEVQGMPVEVVGLQGLVVEFAKQHDIQVLLRGVRTVTDFEYEYPMAMTNRQLAAEVESVFVMPNERYAYLSSSLIKEVYAAGGVLPKLLPEAVHLALLKRLGSKS